MRKPDDPKPFSRLKLRIRLAQLFLTLTKDDSMIEKLKSRKFWAFVATALITTLGQQLGLSEDAVGWLVAIAGSYIMGQGIANLGEQGRYAIEKFKSRKLWAYVLASLIIAFGDGLGMSPDITKWLAVTVSSYLLGQGISDAGLLGRPSSAR